MNETASSKNDGARLLCGRRRTESGKRAIPVGERDRKENGAPRLLLDGGAREGGAACVGFHGIC